MGKEIGGVRDEGYGRAAIGLFLLCSLVLVFFFLSLYCYDWDGTELFFDYLLHSH